MDDRELIELHGGSASLARKLNMTKPGSVQRVNNWKTRGIPAQVKLDHPDLFLNPVDRAEPAEQQAA